MRQAQLDLTRDVVEEPTVRRTPIRRLFRGTRIGPLRRVSASGRPGTR